jgi:hypothetical protein
MKFSNETLTVLRNFSAINPSILFKPGTTLRTIHPQKTIMASAEVNDNIPANAGIYDLSRFLATLSLFEDPEIEFTDDRFIISSGKSTTTYTYAAESMIISPPDKKLELPNCEATVQITWKDLDSITKAAGILKLPDILFENDGSTITMSVVDARSPTSDVFSISIAEGAAYSKFKMYIKVENLKLMQNDYSVSLSSKGLAHFKANKLDYWIALEAK